MENEELTTINPEEEEELTPTQELIQNTEGRDLDPYTPTIEPEVLGPAQYSAPFRRQIGNSTVELAVPEHEQTMKSEYDEWWNFGKKRGFLGVPYISDEFKGERDKLKQIAKSGKHLLEGYFLRTRILLAHCHVRKI